MLFRSASSTISGICFNPTKSPAGYFVVNSAADVQVWVRCAAPVGLALTPKGAGHSYEKHAYGADNDIVVVYLQRLDQITVESGREPC